MPPYCTLPYHWMLTCSSLKFSVNLSEEILIMSTVINNQTQVPWEH